MGIKSWLLLAACVAPLCARAADVSAAVAASLAAPMKALAQAFERETGHRVVPSIGSTGALYAQVVHGAPFHVFLSADSATAQRLEVQGHAVAGTRLTFAQGRLALWSATPGRIDDRGAVLALDGQSRLAVANPKVAPYGAAALEVLERLGHAPRWRSRLVQGENMAQVHQFVASGNAPLGFVALAQVMHDGQWRSGSGWVVPQALHSPLLHDAVLLQRGAQDAAARAFLAFLTSETARQILRRHGYEP